MLTHSLKNFRGFLSTCYQHMDQRAQNIGMNFKKVEDCFCLSKSHNKKFTREMDIQ